MLYKYGGVTYYRVCAWLRVYTGYHVRDPQASSRSILRYPIRVGPLMFAEGHRRAGPPSTVCGGLLDCYLDLLVTLPTWGAYTELCGPSVGIYQGTHRAGPTGVVWCWFPVRHVIRAAYDFDRPIPCAS